MALILACALRHGGCGWLLTYTNADKEEEDVAADVDHGVEGETLHKREREGCRYM